VYHCIYYLLKICSVSRLFCNYACFIIYESSLNTKSDESFQMLSNSSWDVIRVLNTRLKSSSKATACIMIYYFVLDWMQVHGSSVDSQGQLISRENPGAVSCQSSLSSEFVASLEMTCLTNRGWKDGEFQELRDILINTCVHPNPNEPGFRKSGLIHFREGLMTIILLWVELLYKFVLPHYIYLHR
jgi:hypothetical protein